MRAGIIATCFLLHAAMSPAATGPDPRVKLSTLTHNWLDSIGHLEVPVTRYEQGRRRHFTEHCTAVIVSPGPSPLIVTAWHCLDGYQSLLEPIRLTLPGDPPVAVQVVASGGSMEQDWAILKANAADRRPVLDSHITKATGGWREDQRGRLCTCAR